MSNPIKQADLVARALNALPEDERARVDRALEADETLRLEFEAIAGHMLRYDALPDAPPAPPFARIAERMDGDEDPDLRILRLNETRGGRWIPFAAAAAAAIVAAILFALPGRQETSERPAIARGPGMEIALRPHGSALRCEQTAEARIGTRTRVVMEGGSTLLVQSERSVRLEAGRAWFEVEPGPFEVDLGEGASVRVLGTVFEVDVRHGRSIFATVTVVEGEVSVGEGDDRSVVEAGETIRKADVRPTTSAPGAWFRMPTLRVEARGAAPVVGKPIELALVLTNPGHVPMPLEGPESARTPVWLRFETAEGELLRELPVLASNVVSGLELLEPRGSVVLAPGSRTVLAVRILPPFASPGAYRCTALYRASGSRSGGQAPVLSSPLDIEVR